MHILAYHPDPGEQATERCVGAAAHTPNELFLTPWT